MDKFLVYFWFSINKKIEKNINVNIDGNIDGKVVFMTLNRIFEHEMNIKLVYFDIYRIINLIHSNIIINRIAIII